MLGRREKDILAHLLIRCWTCVPSPIPRTASREATSFGHAGSQDEPVTLISMCIAYGRARCS